MVNYSDSEIDHILRLYDIYSNSIHKYNTIIWQLPAALLTVNILGIRFLIDKPYILKFIPFLNFAVIHSLFKQIYVQRAIINALKNIEKKLELIIGKDMIPDFTYPRIIGIKSGNLISWILLVLNIIFLYFIIKL